MTMGRAERRRQERQALKPIATYTLTKAQIDEIKRNATNEALDTAFILMLGLPVMVLHDKFNKIWRKEKRLENFTNELLELYDGFNQGYFTLEDIILTLKEETGLDVIRKR